MISALSCARGHLVDAKTLQISVAAQSEENDGYSNEIDMEVRKVRHEDAAQLAQLLNEIIARGGTTAYQAPFTLEHLKVELLTGAQVLCCFVAQDSFSGSVLGFQSLLKADYLPDGIADIATFVQVGLTQKGVGSSLFSASRAEALQRGFVAINATIRADNLGGLVFYSRQGFADFDVIHDLPLYDGTRIDRICKRYSLI